MNKPFVGGYKDVIKIISTSNETLDFHNSRLNKMTIWWGYNESKQGERINSLPSKEVVEEGRLLYLSIPFLSDKIIDSVEHEVLGDSSHLWLKNSDNRDNFSLEVVLSFFDILLYGKKGILWNKDFLSRKRYESSQLCYQYGQ